MSSPAEQRRERLTADHAALAELARASTLFTFEAQGSTPERYTFIFRGRGVQPDPGGRITTSELHRCDVRLPARYPAAPPDVCFLTPLVHPNIPFGGVVRLEDLGLPWQPQIGLEVVCERLWDAVRLAYVDPDHATNDAAKLWYEGQREYLTPVDPRPLRNEIKEPNRNVIKYHRRSGSPATLDSNATGDLFYITDDAPCTAPARASAAAEVWYLGDE